MIDNEAMLIVSTHSRPKAAGLTHYWMLATSVVSTHSRLKAAGAVVFHALQGVFVSTHSRLKAAGPVLADCELLPMFQHTAA